MRRVVLWIVSCLLLVMSSSQAGNVRIIKQHTPDVGGMGGDYINEYDYDNQYRLTQSVGYSSYPLDYNFSMDYSPAGRLGTNICQSAAVRKQLSYGYDNASLTHQPRVVFDAETNKPFDLYWDANGNLAQVIDCDREATRFHEWDEENRLRAVIGPKKVGFYGYDGNGNRVWKLTGTCDLSSQNGGELYYTAFLDDAVLYPNPYITISPTGYTKHYYLGQERVATGLGEGGWMSAVKPFEQDEFDAIIRPFLQHFNTDLPCEKYPETQNLDILGERPQELQYGCHPACLTRLGLAFKPDYLLECIESKMSTSGEATELFFTHSNHLGSASWITDKTATPVQYIHYAPYGELLANQIAIGYDERYKFTGKERDAESGYDFFGARYWWLAGTWLSVDPLVDKYLTISPYAFCTWNPIKYVDPDGRRSRLSIKKDVITISAIYYVKKSDLASAQKAVGFWNNQKNLRYKSSNGKEYNVQFNLKIRLSKDPVKDAGGDVDLDANSYEISSTLGPNINGQTDNNYKIQIADAKKETLTGAHEVGHTLMKTNNQDDEHTSTGVMTPYATSPGRSETVSQETVDRIVESNGFEQKNQTIWQRIKSLFE